jgi:GT2 family glycosyltransferase
MTGSPLVSVCIANYNGARIIEECIESVLNQSGGVQFEIIVHDDCSTDDSAALIESRYRNVKLIRSDTNVGFCASNNRMAAAAHGEFLLLLNNDAALMEDAIATFHAAATAVGRPAILGLPQYDAESGELIDRGCLLDPFLNPVPNLDAERCDVGMVIGACLWIPKALWAELGGFPEWFESVGEDLYLCSRARLRGCPVIAVGRSGYRHYVGRSFGGGKLVVGRLATTFRRRALSERNKTYVMIMTYPSPLMQIVLPIHLLLLMIEGALLAFFAWRLDILARIYWPVLAAIGGERRRLGDGRREAMAARRVGVRRFFAGTDVWPHKLRMLWKFGLPRLR